MDGRLCGPTGVPLQGTVETSAGGEDGDGTDSDGEDDDGSGKIA
jgi:hypothetical protein